MKRFLILLLLAVIAAPAFADDALTIPENVIRFRAVPSVTIQNQNFDDDGKRQDLTSLDGLQLYDVSFALEYGVTHWATAAVQWTPGWRIASVLDGYQDTQNDDLKLTGLNDMFVGAKLQIVGENAPVSSTQHRLAASLGSVVPLSTFDAKTESQNYIDGDPYRTSRVGRDLFGLGARAHYDFVIRDGLFINLYNEFIYYFPRDLKQFGVTIDPSTGQLTTDVTESEYDYGYKLTAELEPYYATQLSDGLELGFGLPLTYVNTPELEIDGSGQGDDGYSFDITPSVNLFAQNLPWPIDFELSYTLPVAGKNTGANHTIALQIKNYLQF